MATPSYPTYDGVVIWSRPVLDEGVGRPGHPACDGVVIWRHRRGVSEHPVLSALPAACCSISHDLSLLQESLAHRLYSSRLRIFSFSSHSFFLRSSSLSLWSAASTLF